MMGLMSKSRIWLIIYLTGTEHQQFRLWVHDTFGTLLRPLSRPAPNASDCSIVPIRLPTRLITSLGLIAMLISFPLHKTPPEIYEARATEGASVGRVW